MLRICIHDELPVTSLCSRESWSGRGLKNWSALAANLRALARHVSILAQTVGFVNQTE
jgi:hypothetical protein